MACASLPSATFPEGRSTMQPSPALAAYAANAAEVLPVEAHPTTLHPSSTALETPTVMPLSLKEPVGFVPSYLTYKRSIPRSRAKARQSYKGVPPSSNVTAFLASTGRKGAYLQTPKGAWRNCFGPFPFMAERSISTFKSPPQEGQASSFSSFVGRPHSKHLIS